MGGKGPKVPQSSVDTNVNLQNTEAGLLKQYSSIAIPGITTANNYWTSLLQGGPAAQAATAPYAETIAGQTAANQKQIQNTLPQGGQKELAEAQNLTQSGASVANLYQGLGPQAAAALSGTSLGAAGAGTSSGGVSASAGAANENLAASQAAAKGNLFGGVGSGVGSLLGGVLGSKGSGGGGKGSTDITSEVKG